MDIRNKLAALIYHFADFLDKRTAKYLADHLIANGVTVQEQGQWTENQHTTYNSTWGEDVYWYTYTCSVCGSEAMNNSSYCPFCGNPMLPQPPKGE